MVKVKICGITNVKDALMAAGLGAWALGFVFYKKSPRCISPSKARKIIEALPPFVTPVGVFVNHNERAVADICRYTRIRVLQFHGDETPLYCKRFKDYKIIKAFRLGEEFDFAKLSEFKVDAFLFDAFQEDQYGGTGRTFNWELLKGRSFSRPYILAGGLNTENIAQALASVDHLYAVDVSSGVEISPGQKDYQGIKLFLNFISKI